MNEPKSPFKDEEERLAAVEEAKRLVKELGYWTFTEEPEEEFNED